MGRAPYDSGTLIYHLLGAVSPGGLMGLSRALFQSAAQRDIHYSVKDLFARARRLSDSPVIAEAEALSQMPQPDAPAALRRALQLAGAEVVVSYEDLKRDDALELLLGVLGEVMRKDCRGALSLSPAKAGFEIQGQPRCQTLNAPRYHIRALADTPLSDPVLALQMAEQDCMSEGRLALGITEKQLVSLPCPAQFPQRLWLRAWPALSD